MITTLLVFGYLGMLAFLLFDIQDFNKKTPDLNFKETIERYFSFNQWLKLILGILFIAVLMNIALTQGGDWIIKYMTANIIDGDTPAELKIFALITGIANQFLWDKLINIFSKNNHEIKTQ